MMTYEYFCETWGGSSEDVYYIFTENNSRIKYKNLYKMYCYVHNMTMKEFRHSVECFVEVHNFTNWRERLNWLDNHHKEKFITIERMISLYGWEEGKRRLKTYCEETFHRG